MKYLKAGGKEGGRANSPYGPAFDSICVHPLESSINTVTVQSGWSIVYMKGSQKMISKNKKSGYLSLINFGLANNSLFAEMPLWLEKVKVRSTKKSGF